MKRILVVEDDPDIQEMLCAYLRDAGYETGTAGDGLAALDRFHSGVWNLILLDIMLPKVDGYGVCELIRRESSVPVIMLTALDAEENQLKGFDLDVDDYVTKPFSMPVLLRKIAAVLRRAGNGEVENSLLLYQDLILDLDAYRVTEGGQPVDLTSREFELLWNYDFLGDERIVDSHIKNLRKKLKGDYIETVRGVGYRVEKVH